MADHKTEDDLALNQLFEAAKNSAPEPTPAFMAQLSNDMESALPKPSEKTLSPEISAFGWLSRLFAAASLSGAAALGVWLGFLMPDLLTDPSLIFATDTTIAFTDFLPAANLADTDGVSP